MKTIHKIGIGVGILAIGLSLKAAAAAKKLAAIFEKMTIKLYGLPRNIQFDGFREIRFTIDVILTNPTNQEFSVSGYLAVLKKVVLEYKGQYLGSANVNIEEVTVPSNDTMIIHDIQIAIALSTLAENAMEFYQLMQQGMPNYDDISLIGVIDAPGGPYQIG